MTATELAIIDIGSNSIRYAAEADGVPGEKRIFTTRLGSGLNSTGMLGEGPMLVSLGVIKQLADEARAAGLAPYAYATSAVRDAENGAEFARRIEAECGVPVEILSGEQEARLAFLGAADGGESFDSMLDIGGASMQIVNKGFAKSWRAGCVRCGDIGAQSIGLEGLRAQTSGGISVCDMRPADQRLAIEIYMDTQISLPEGLGFGRTVGVGGSITTLAAIKTGLESFDPALVNRVRLSLYDIETMISRLIAMGSERRSHPMLLQRHDVILYGAYILSHALRLMRVNEIGVSCGDGLEGYFYELKRRFE